MFNKILIANRGEIAVRVAHTARRLGIGCVAVYSNADKDALHVEACDEAWCIGPASAAESYLDSARILEVAAQTGVDAIHPGYGFLSENAEFARACAAAGIVFIGPPASAIEAMGSKSEAKALMEAAGVPLIPGYHGEAQDDAGLLEVSRKMKYPQLIKASAGGGGKGMRRVETEQEFGAALTSARREAAAAFGDDRVLIERYLEKPRHVEMQVFADSHGNYVHLFERDCSIQRRHQKILEEAPAPGISKALRKRMGKAALECARAVGYLGAGTVEFLLDRDGSFYFMEMNTRLQVEHPVSEMITGQDLVEWQLRVAAGEALPLTQGHIEIDGHAIEARIYAETPENDFMPAAGRIGYLQLPEPAAGLRVDIGVRRGDQIGIYYDPMIAKLIAHGVDRDAARAKLAQALNHFRILGLNTNLGFLSNLLEVPELIDGDIDTGFIATHHARLFAERDANLQRAIVLAAAALFPGLDNRPDSGANASPWDARDGWRLNLIAAQCIRLESASGTHEIRVTREDGYWLFESDGQAYAIAGGWYGEQRMRVEIDVESVEFPVLCEPGAVSLCYHGQTFRFRIPDAAHASDSGAVDADHPRAPMSGAVVALPVSVGDTVEPGDTLMVIEAMKMEHAITAQIGASVAEILFSPGDQVEEGDTLVVLEVE